MVKVINDMIHYDNLIENNEYIVIDFFADWCGPCKKISPIFAKFETMYEDVLFCKVDIEENEDIADLFNVNSLPTFIGIENGKISFIFEGANEIKLEQHIQKMLN